MPRHLELKKSTALRGDLRGIEPLESKEGLSILSIFSIDLFCVAGQESLSADRSLFGIMLTRAPTPTCPASHSPHIASHNSVRAGFRSPPVVYQTRSPKDQKYRCRTYSCFKSHTRRGGLFSLYIENALIVFPSCTILCDDILFVKEPCAQSFLATLHVSIMKINELYKSHF